MNLQRLFRRPLRLSLFGLIGVMGLQIASTARADFTQQSDVVIYTPSSIAGVSGQLPFTYQFVLGITSPGKMRIEQTTIGLSAVCPVAPRGADPEVAKRYATFSAATLSYGAPNERKDVLVTISIPSSAITGTYGFKIKATGWEAVLPSGVTLTNAGCDVNLTVSSVGPAFNPPSVAIQTPVNGITVSASALPASVPFSFTVTASGPNGSAISSIAWDLDGSPVPITINSLVDQNGTPIAASVLPAGTFGVTGSGTMLVSKAGAKKLTVRATNLGGTQSAWSIFTVQIASSPPVVQITSPLPDAVYAYNVEQARPRIPFSFTATSGLSSITGHTARLNGTDLQPTIVPNSSTNSITGTVSNLVNAITGTNTLVVTATDAADRTSTPVSSNFLVNPISAMITSPAADPIVLPPGVVTTNAGLRFTVASIAHQPVSAVNAKLDGLTVTPLSANVGASSVIATGTLSNVAIGPHTVEVTGISSGLPITHSRTFRVKGTPNIQWATPTPISFGTKLSASQLGATADVGGTFVYSHAMDTVLDVGTHVLRATFTPRNADHYISVSALVTLRVEPLIGALNGFVFLDLNEGGIADSNELGLPEIPVQLRLPQVSNTMTTLDGKYGFGFGSGTYEVLVTVPPGMRAIGGSVRQVEVSGSTTLQIGLAFDFAAISRMTADGATIGFWKNNLEKLRDRKGGTQITATELNVALASIETLALDVYNGGLLTSDEAIRLMSSTSSMPLALLQKQLVAAELNFGTGRYIGSSPDLTRAFIAWGEMFVKQPGVYQPGDFKYAREWLEAYNSSHGATVNGPRR